MFDLHACLHTVGCLDPVGAKKENRTHMKLELQTVMICHGGARNRIQI